MKKTAFIFPGQGAQKLGMGQDFYEGFEESREVYDWASENLNMDMKALCFEENDRLNITRYTQPALLATEIAMLKVIEAKGIVPAVTAGLSLGEYGALVAAKKCPGRMPFGLLSGGGCLCRKQCLWAAPCRQ